ILWSLVQAQHGLPNFPAILHGFAAVAQLDRVLGYEPRGRGFESCQPRHNEKPAVPTHCRLFSLRRLHTMSKAFTRETDSEDDAETGAASIVPGGKNYITRHGYDRLRRELMVLMDEERPKVVEAVHW